MKQFKGVIANWKREHGHIAGTALWHEYGMTLAEAIAHPSPGAIANGYPINTSELLGTVFAAGDFEVVETRNSYYVLIGKEQQ